MEQCVLASAAAMGHGVGAGGQEQKRSGTEEETSEQAGSETGKGGCEGVRGGFGRGHG